MKFPWQRRGRVETLSFNGLTVNRAAPPEFLISEISAQEYAILGRQFVGESVFHGPSLSFAGGVWESRIAVIQGRVYKICLEKSFDTKQAAVDASVSVSKALQALFGRSAEVQTGVLAWDAADGNIIMQLANVSGRRAVLVFLTSSLVHNAPRLS